MADDTPPDASGTSGSASTPAASSTAATGSPRASRRAAPSAASEAPSPADDTTSATGEAEGAAADAPPAPRPGWYRNCGNTPLTVQPDGYPAALLAPGGAAWLPDDPCHADTEPCDAPAPAEVQTETE